MHNGTIKMHNANIKLHNETIKMHNPVNNSQLYLLNNNIT